MTDKTEFRIGDKVSNLGRVGKVVEVLSSGDYPVIVEHDDASTGSPDYSTFMLDGRLHLKQTEPSLKLIESRGRTVFVGITAFKRKRLVCSPYFQTFEEIKKKFPDHECLKIMALPKEEK